MLCLLNAGLALQNDLELYIKICMTEKKKQMSFEYLDDVCLLPYIIAVISAKRLENKRIGYLMLPTNFPKTVFSQILKTVFCKTIPPKNRLEATQGAALLSSCSAATRYKND